MFKCEKCGRLTSKREKQHKVVVKKEEVDHYILVKEKQVKTGRGSQIAKEISVCGGCNGTDT